MNSTTVRQSTRRRVTWYSRLKGPAPVVLLMGESSDITEIDFSMITERLLDGFWILAAQNEALDEICSFLVFFKIIPKKQNTTRG